MKVHDDLVRISAFPQFDFYGLVLEGSGEFVCEWRKSVIRFNRFHIRVRYFDMPPPIVSKMPKYAMLTNGISIYNLNITHNRRSMSTNQILSDIDESARTEEGVQDVLPITGKDYASTVLELLAHATVAQKIFRLEVEIGAGEKLIAEGAGYALVKSRVDAAYAILRLHSPLPHADLSEAENAKMAELAERHNDLSMDFAMMDEPSA